MDEDDAVDVPASDSSSNVRSHSKVAAKVPFAKLCGLIERVNRARGVDSKKILVRKFADEWRQLHKNMYGSEKTSDSFFPVMRLLLPQCDKSRLAYGIKEHTLAKLYIEILCLGKDSPDSLKLLNYKSPKHARNSVGDFAEVVYFVLKNRCPEEGSLTVEDVNNALTDIAEGNTEKGAVRKNQVKGSLLRLLRNTSALEQKWLVRILMKELKCGISHTSILNTFHQDAESLFDVSQDLEKVCQQLHDPEKRLHEIEISLFSPFRPMLADRGYPSRIEQQMNGQRFILETKFDGERIQLHKDGDHYRYWSRNGNEWTDSFGQDPYHGNLTPYIHKCFAGSVKSCILDGEMMGYNVETESMGSKAQEYDIKRAGVEERTGYVPCFIVFDIVYLNGDVLSNKPLQERKTKLADCFIEEHGRLMHSVWTEANSRDECARALNRAVDERDEGVMAKRLDSVYAVANRKGGWFKLKPEYVGGMMDELDCLIVGGYFGSGHRSGMVSHFMLAVANDGSRDEQGHPTRFHSICKVGSGYSKQTLVEYNRRMAPHWHPFDRHNPPSWLKLERERPDLWIEPRESCIVQIKASEIVGSEAFATACTLRFPRVECFRDDKSWHECMTVSELTELRQSNEGKLASRHVDPWSVDFDDEAGPSNAKRQRRGKGGAVVRARPTVASRFLGIDTTAVEKQSEILAGRELCVMACDTGKGQSKAELEESIVASGGAVVQNPGLGTFAVIADKITAKVKNIMQRGNYDVIRSEWLMRCVSQKHFLQFHPSEVVHVTKATEKIMSSCYDASGDSFIVPIANEDELSTLMNRVDGDKVDLETDSVQDLIHEHFSEEFGLFLNFCFYVDDKLVIGDLSTRIKGTAFDLLRVDLLRAGGRIEDEGLTSDVSHVIVDRDWDVSRIKDFQSNNARRRLKFHIVDKSWVCACLEANDLKNERTFSVS